MAKKFSTPNALRLDGTSDVGASSVRDLLEGQRWDFVLMQDFTQAPARAASRGTRATARDRRLRSGRRALGDAALASL